MVSWAELEGAPRGQGDWEILGHPNTIDGGDAMAGSLLKSSQGREVWVSRDNCLSEGMSLAEGSPGRLPDVTIDICHKDDGVPSGLPRGEGG